MCLWQLGACHSNIFGLAYLPLSHILGRLSNRLSFRRRLLRSCQLAISGADILLCPDQISFVVRHEPTAAGPALVVHNSPVQKLAGLQEPKSLLLPGWLGHMLRVSFELSRISAHSHIGVHLLRLTICMNFICSLRNKLSTEIVRSRLSRPGSGRLISIGSTRSARLRARAATAGSSARVPWRPC